MPGLASAADDPSAGVRVVVTPSQSSFFAGELFSVTVTFTNTHSQSQPGPSSSTSRHKRGAHSISSAPLARPPTSPGPPSTPVPTSARFATASPEDASVRRGLVGKVPVPQAKGSEELPELLEQRRRRLLAKSLSVSIAPWELEEQIGEANVAAAPKSGVLPGHPPTSPRVSSPLTRSETLSLGSKHPHARKQSLIDGQAEVSAPTPASSSSTFSLALDPIVEGVSSPYPSTPSLASPTIETPTHGATVYAYPRAATRRQSQMSLGHGYPSGSLKTPRAASDELILYSYAQLKGTLSLTPSPSLHSTQEQRHTLAATRAALLKRNVVGGGRMDISASLSPGVGHRRRPTHSRTASFSSGLMNLISSAEHSSLVPSPSFAPSSSSSLSPSHDFPAFPGRTNSLGHRARPSTSLIQSPRTRFVSSPAAPASAPVGLGIGGLGIDGGGGAVESTGIRLGQMEEEEVDPEAPLPTFEVQPAMLAVDLVLGPGESRSYTYSLPLPDILPPTFKGRTLKFAYELEVGTCRAGSAAAGLMSKGSVSRVMRVPIRVYGSVVVGRTPRPYDVLWPLSKGATAVQGKVVEETGKVVNRAGKGPIVPPQPASAPLTGTFDDLRDYARRLLGSFPDPSARGVRIKLPAEAISPVPQSASPRTDGFLVGGGGGGEGYGVWAEEEKRLEREMEREMERAEGGLSGCREAVEILTRNPKKASYDVNKDGVKVAVLTFAKGAYRLGETVVGVVEINERQSRARVVQLSAILEAHESLPSTISPQTPTRQLKRVHAEHHSSHLLSTLRTTFTLDIPSDAAPAFQVRVGQDVPGGPVTRFGGLEWKVRLCLLVAVVGGGAGAGVGGEGEGAGWVGSEGVRVRGMRREGGRGEWGSCWVATRGLAPMEKVVPMPQRQRQQRRMSRAALNKEVLQSPKTMGWGAFLAASLFGAGTGTAGIEAGTESGDVEGYDEEEEGEEEEEEGYDGIKPDLAGGVGVGVSYGGGEDGWKDVRMETVECEVPVRIWPGNTAFKAADIVFDV
ncbi:Retrograde Golgi transport protein RGP1 like protein [Termitomyces sp. T112]|nr:Retrograde Golgi transport protein RGP1 like protein [Termitomyces sp. T112]